ncbi:protein IQ-DOMAIN 33 [Cornus florida]|uniref:protein IQ-DOMAIN 33 n=1 Tax=Cornus florida TaxID=4283 RepID=UPI0028984089|nr:protein IQ-DOMAIN 33 [Cornus florida]XP_059662925.1 protein IQ-DOMAIN 33 [Cornus florida]XP_059662926.1 protein IQ-DOMAIN 33 [Cornus florida]XP_059662927.1 protein IQ-DOMAIN 33 [Cornus florida]
MGITGELVRNVFSKSRSIGTHESIVRSSSVEKRRWSSVRLYLCGDEFNSVLAEEDSASVRSSEPTITQPTPESSETSIRQSMTTVQEPTTLESSESSVTQPVLEDLTDKGYVQNEETKGKLRGEKHNSTAELFREEDAATVIQSAFRDFLARRRKKGHGLKLMDAGQELVVGTWSPSWESVGTSIEVQTGNSVEVFSIAEESMTLHHRVQQKARTEVLKLKEDWDDSTVSSNISKMRIQNRLEATTRRERALAYAFSQQLRVCSKKKQTTSSGREPNMGWSWLERWMATRFPESSSIENHTGKKLEPINGKFSNQRSVVRKRFLDEAGEEKESCGSNEVSVQFDSISVSTPKQKYDTKPARNRLKTTRAVSRRKTAPSYHYPKQHSKASKKDCPREDEKDIKQKQNESGGHRKQVADDDPPQF